MLKGNRSSKWFFIVIILSVGLILWQTAHWSRESALANLEAGSRHQLSLYVAHLQGQLEKYEFLPELLATNKRLVHLLQHPEDPERIEALNRYLENISRITNASDTYLMDARGLTIAASNWLSARPFVGRNFNYRPYFKEAMKGRLGRYFALGSTSNRRGYYFAYPVRHLEEILGAVVFKIDIAELEQGWSHSGDEFIVSDPDGVIFITTNKEWRFKALKPLRPEVMERITLSRRYADARLQPMAILQAKTVAKDARIVKLSHNKAVNYLVIEQGMPEAGWKVHILTDLKPVTAQIFRVLLLAAFLLGVIVLSILFWVQRNRRIKEQRRFERQVKRNLEYRVKERTKDLTETNIRLTHEIDERRRTEGALRQAQDELIQTAKMAALGQLSAGINHELNQPLAAIRSYADNACALLTHDRKEDASWNLRQISELTERMAKISAQLKFFARKTSGLLVSVSLPAVIDNSLKIMSARIKETETNIRVRLPEKEIYLLADMVQLEQVMVNLVGNALHALEGSDNRLVEIAAAEIDGKVNITIRDNGSGIKEIHLGRIFDPFFTTKEEEHGLGLGLSISHRIVEGMEGKLTASNHPDGGAVFNIQLGAAADWPEREVQA